MNKQDFPFVPFLDVVSWGNIHIPVPLVPVCFESSLQDKGNEACAIPRKANELHRGPDAEKQLRFCQPVEDPEQNAMPTPLPPVTDRPSWPNDPVADKDNDEGGSSEDDEICAAVQGRPRWVEEGGVEHTRTPANDKARGNEGPACKPRGVRVVVILCVDCRRSGHEMLLIWSVDSGTPRARNHTGKAHDQGRTAHDQLRRLPDVGAGEGSGGAGPIHDELFKDDL